MRIKLLLLALVVLLLVALLWQYDYESESEGRVVVAFYMVANQKLEEDIAEDYQEIVEGSYNCSGVIYVAYQSESGITFRRVERGEVTDLSSTLQVPTLISRYSMQSFLSTIYRMENVEELILILGGENSGRNRLFYREGSFLTPEDLNSAFSMVDGLRISLLQIDMCSAINYEVLTAAAPYCNFIIGSEIEIHSKGHRYDKELLVLNDFQKDRLLTTERILDIFTAEHRYYRTNAQFSLVSAEGFLEWRDEIEAILAELESPQIENESVIKGDYVDLRLALESLADVSNKTVRERIGRIMGGWQSIVVKSCAMTEEYSRMGGIGYYLPEM